MAALSFLSQPEDTSSLGAAQRMLTHRCVRLLCMLRMLWPRGQVAVTTPAGPQPPHLHRVLLHRTALGRLTPAPNSLPQILQETHSFCPMGQVPWLRAGFDISPPAAASSLASPGPSRADIPQVLHPLRVLTPDCPTSQQLKKRKKINKSCYHLECLKRTTCSFLLGISTPSANHQNKAKIPGGNVL